MTVGAIVERGTAPNGAPPFRLLGRGQREGDREERRGHVSDSLVYWWNSFLCTTSYRYKFSWCSTNATSQRGFMEKLEIIWLRIRLKSRWKLLKLYLGLTLICSGAIDQTIDQSITSFVKRKSKSNNSKQWRCQRSNTMPLRRYATFDTYIDCLFDSETLCQHQRSLSLKFLDSTTWNLSLYSARLKSISILKLSNLMIIVIPFINIHLGLTLVIIALWTYFPKLVLISIHNGLCFTCLNHLNGLSHFIFN